MAIRVAARYVSRRLSSNGKILSEEEKAAENVYIKSTRRGSCMVLELHLEVLDLQKEKEKLEKLARKGPKPEEQPTTSSGGSVADAKLSDPTSTSGVSTDKNRNYAVLAGVITGLGALGWYLKASAKKPEEVQD
ncbi:hypothetical protein HHK36_011412 [Tetracentron sinense]|uniref:Uncharacterized protein n=1 Tax=Tetracentron sinense TaxID=13715 RepID=A0A834ZAC7_TETSI|nr:hypothetical protein HHK36_011412 [Tetracentron sinense]